MLSRVADSLYWMSRYFERADHCARVLEANYNLMLNPTKPSTEQRWNRIAACLGLGSDAAGLDPQTAILRLTCDSSNRSSIISCLASARENASQIREQISSEMWERLNQLYHEVRQFSTRTENDSEPLPLLTAVREGAYKFHGVTDGTISHGEGWQFIQFGKYMERACALSILLDAHFSASAGADDLDWVGLLVSCSAFEAYCKVYTADLKPDHVAEFLLFSPEFPYSVRYSADRMGTALEAIKQTSAVRKTSRIERLIGMLRSSLSYVQIDEIIARDLHRYLNSVIEQCRRLHAAVHELYIGYPIEAALGA
ncbi:MAG: alpha-E domain-containing protein [Acidobacteriaceae bacterium]|nr:alpha-E domain-containing protein [Acidobacteriaceae bacterium]MBV9779952.1 alpha-E domain-containing protein [Acidobacteriaceae bacterium]